MTDALLAVAAVWIFAVAGLVLMLLAEVVAAMIPRTRTPRPDSECIPPYRVLIPAHDEAGTIQPTIAAVLAQLPVGQRPLVVADNCTDDTAWQARLAGAEVIERFDAERRGKGHALAFGLAHLRRDPPAVLVMLDADCIAQPGTLDLLAARAAADHRPVQAMDRMLARAGSPLRVRMGAFAWALKNEVRPLGLHRLGLPCQLMGTGMAFPWSSIASVDLATGHLAEDMELGWRLARAGQAPVFCPEARVESWFPEGQSALDGQRRRWEHGHLSMILDVLVSLLRHPRGGGGAGGLALALDLCVPPLALLALLVVVSGGLGAWMLAQGWVGAAWVAAASVLGFGGAVLLAWWRVGRQWVGLGELAFVPVYVLRKLPVYAGFVLRRQKEWVRTSRHAGH